MFRIAGVANNDTRLLLQGIQNCIQLVGAIFGALLTDKWGRRPQLLVSTSIMVAIFVIITILNATNPDISHTEDSFNTESPAQSKAQIAMIFLFGFVYSCGWTPNQSMYPVEVLRYESRAKGMGMYNVSLSFEFSSVVGVREPFLTSTTNSSSSTLRFFTTRSLRRLPSPLLDGDIISSSSFGICSKSSSSTSSSSKPNGERSRNLPKSSSRRNQ